MTDSLRLLFLKRHPGDDALARSTDRARGRSPAGLIALAGLLLFAPLVEGGTTHHAVMIIRLLILLTAALYVADGIRTGAIVLPRLSIAPALLAFLGVAVAWTLWSPYRHQSVQWLLVLSSYAALLYLAAGLARTWRDVAWLVAVLGAVGLAEGVWVLTQGGWFGAVRPSGTFFNPNFVAGYCAATWTLVLSLVCYRKGAGIRGGPSVGRQVALTLGLVAAMGVLLAAVLWTESRGGALALVAGTGLVLGARYGWKGLATLVLVLMIGVVVPNPVRDRVVVEHEVNPVGYARVSIWHSALRAASEHPLGVGLGLYQYQSPRYLFPIEGQLMRYGRVARTAHNEYLQLTVELGLAGLAAFLWGLVGVSREARRAWRVRLRRWQRGLLVGLCGAAASVLAHAAVDSNLHAPALAVLLTVCVALILSARRLSGAVPEAARIIPVGRGVALGSGAVLVIGAIAIYVVTLGKAWTAYEVGSDAMARQDLSRAIQQYRTAADLAPGKALYRSALAAAHFRAFRSSRDLEAARASLRELHQAAALNPLDGRLYGLLGHVYGTLAGLPPGTRGWESPGDGQRAAWLRAARDAYVQALEREPASSFYRLELGKILLTLGDAEAAQAAVRQAVDLEPNFLAARVWLGQRYLASGRQALAEAELRQVVERRQRYAGWPKNAVEARLLDVDLVSFENALQSARAGRS